MIDQVKVDQKTSVRKSCAVLGFRRQTYYDRKQGHRPEELDRYIDFKMALKDGGFIGTYKQYLRKP